ncbi:MAG: DNA-binding transcriptional regulator, Lrp family [Candidatus Methanohalarchaeum thermophilum]|uniref:DNA-binding transcriptional regulator, Lrp family n=1 Tax=Methanohalarchaeum thermophilum TaxID=1903181 RepID=A0A1Q6DS06_METT1|nr:MAG: DNA-binding transcriptional regulator, Lrp family [Candidatus Methanohalarchaeum thermophilum]
MSDLDKVDKRIIYRLSKDSKNINAPELAEELNVSSATIRNRIRKLEQKEIIKGYHAEIDYTKINNKLTVLFKCSSPSIKDRPKLAKKTQTLKNIVQIKEITSGSVEDLLIKAVVQDSEEITKTANKLEEIGLKVKDEDLIIEEYFSSYSKFGPKEDIEDRVVKFKKLSGKSEIADITLTEKSSISNKKIKEIADILPEECLIVAVERKKSIISPNGETKLKPGDIISLFSSKGIDQETLKTILG